MKLKILVAFSVVALTGCFSQIKVENTNVERSKKTIWLAPFKVNCSDSEEQCFAANGISTDESVGWQPFVEQINGFNHEAGMFYKLAISVGSKIDEKSKQIVVSYNLEQVLKKTTQHFLPTSLLTNKRRWQLKQFPTMPDLSNSTLKELPYIILSEEGLVGFSGCNRMFGKQTLLFEATDHHNSKIKFGPIAMTRMACIEPNANLIEHQMTLTLSQVEQFSVHWPFLNFYVNDKLIAQFVAQDWD